MGRGDCSFLGVCRDREISSVVEPGEWERHQRVITNYDVTHHLLSRLAQRQLRRSCSSSSSARCQVSFVEASARHSHHRLLWRTGTFNNHNKLWCESTTNPVPVLRIAASRGFSELTKNAIRSSHGHSTPSLKFHANRSSRFLVILLTKKQRKKEKRCLKRNRSKIPRSPMYRGRGNNIIITIVW